MSLSTLFQFHLTGQINELSFGKTADFYLHGQGNVVFKPSLRRCGWCPAQNVEAKKHLFNR